MRLTESGTPLGYLMGMITEDRRDWSSSTMAAQPILDACLKHEGRRVMNTLWHDLR
jgi:hypothetical protein